MLIEVSYKYEVHAGSAGDLFRDLQREFGRCISKVYVGDGEQIGWVFQSRQRYKDSNETFIREAWVTVHDEYPETNKTYHYHKFN